MDRRARFEAEIMPHLDAATNLARWLARDSDLADDIVQEAALRAFRSFANEAVDNPKAWLLQIVRNAAYASTRLNRGRLVMVSSMEDAPEPADD
ncbi:MAG: RNA polymerase subunit sigma, partial [Alphaproteobacteria bacterium]|nr:RNA polymerase subunit sigma [Alphaproteobacteria bacterium]